MYKRRVRLYSSLAPLLFVCAALFVSGGAAHAQSRTVPGTVTAAPGKPTEGPALGSMAEEFALPDIHGHLTRLSDLAGGQTVTMLNFWAFWCDTWSAEMPSLRELAEQQGETGFRMAAISVDGSRLPEFLRGTRGEPAPFPVLLDAGGQVSARYRIRHVPTVILLDRQGRVRYCAYGYPGNQVMLNQIRKIINEDGQG